MSTKQEMIEDAFAIAGILPEEEGLQPNELIRMQRELNKMVERWYDDGISLPFYISTNLSDDSGLSLSEEEALSNNLAVKVMAIYMQSKQPNSMMLTLAETSKRTLRNTKTSTAVRKFPSTLPRGAGAARTGGYSYPTFYSSAQMAQIETSNREPMFTDEGSPLFFASNNWS